MTSYPKAGNTGDELLREEFNRWAQAGRGEQMEQNHLPIVEPTLAIMDLQLGDDVLDIGCGSGWLVRRLATLVPRGSAVGIDFSDEMIRRAELASAGIPNARFLYGAAEKIPSASGAFDKVVSVESAYYWPEPARGLNETFRVLRGGGSGWILINYYFDNPYSHQWGEHFRTPTHLLSADEWERLFRESGFEKVNHRRIKDPTPAPDVYTGKWFRDADEVRRFRAEGALLIFGQKL